MSAFLISVSSFLTSAVRQAIPLTLAGLGVAWSERSGILNIGEEGIMLNGAFVGFMVAFITGNLFLGILGGALGGIIIALIHAFLCIRCKANQTIVGLALNFFTQGLTSFVFLLFFGQGSSLPSLAKLKAIKIPLLSEIPVVGNALFNQNILAYILYAAIICFTIIFYKTEWGVKLIAVGENPRAADSAGINVFKIRYLACIINGIFGGIGGSYITLGQLGYFQEDIVSGKGYIALVAVILGRYHPVAVFASAMIIGFAESMQFYLQTKGIPMPSQAFSMMPYVIAVIVLLFSIGRNFTPKALGKPYERDKR